MIERLYQLMLADFRERSRRHSFLILLFANIFLAYLVFAGKFTPRLGDYVGESNSAWTGATVGMSCSLMLLLFGFHTIRDTINRDRDSGVGQILTSGGMGRVAYLYGKVLSNLAVLASMVAAIGLTAAIMQLFWGTDFQPWHLWAPLIVLALPVVAIVAAAAVVFETVPLLRGTFGGVVFFFVAMAALPLGILSTNPMFDLWGFHLFESSMMTSMLARFPDAPHRFMLNPGLEPNLTTFLWTGVDWSWSTIKPHLCWLGIAAIIPAVAFPFFDRFDTHRPARGLRLRDGEAAGDPPTASLRNWSTTVEPLKARMTAAPIALVVEELRLITKTMPLWWSLAALGLIAAQLVSPLAVVWNYLLPLAWVWPIVVWSGMGSLPYRHGMQELLISTPGSSLRRLSACLAAGVMLTLVATSGGILRTATEGQWNVVVSQLIGVACVPTLALSLGTITRSRRLFEVAYLTIWYLGPLNRLPSFDFLGLTETAQAASVPWLFALAAAAPATIAFVRHQRETAWA